ncbi:MULTISPECIES: CAAD domain-containing protein [Aphanothece]|uniref:CAAD domain-containing protein n=1 Tax=Aphanothece TaxID=1121 RepID=UPI00398F8480
MNDTTTEAVQTGEADHSGEAPTTGVFTQDTASGEADGGVNFTERYSEILGKVNQTLDQVDWSQMGRIGKASGIILAVIIAQILIKGVLDTINLLPIVPGLLELLGLVVVGQWSWTNLTTSEKRSAVVARLQGLRKEYLG